MFLTARHRLLAYVNQLNNCKLGLVSVKTAANLTTLLLEDLQSIRQVDAVSWIETVEGDARASEWVAVCKGLAPM